MQTDGSLTLVDYDGMYVPAMQGQKARELGSPDFRHPLRTENDFNEHIDDFPVISILLSLRLIAADPSLLDSYGVSDRLLFAESDYRDLSSCALLKNVFPSHDVDINTLVSLFTIADMHKSLSHVSFRLLTVKKPQKPEKIEIEEEELSTKVTKEDLANAAVDEFGAKYSNDGKRLLKVPSDIKEYKIKDGTKVICDSAFSGCKFLQEIFIPLSVTAIGMYAFDECESLRKIILPANLKTIKANPFFYCLNLSNIYIESSIGLGGLNIIGYAAFWGCVSLQTINLRYTKLKEIDHDAFAYCKRLKEISFPETMMKLGDNLFNGCINLLKIGIPIGSRAIFEKMLPEHKYKLVEEELLLF